jgi:hypothetical protein
VSGTSRERWIHTDREFGSDMTAGDLLRHFSMTEPDWEEGNSLSFRNEGIPEHALLNELRLISSSGAGSEMMEGPGAGETVTIHVVSQASCNSTQPACDALAAQDAALSSPLKWTYRISRNSLSFRRGIDATIDIPAACPVGATTTCVGISVGTECVPCAPGQMLRVRNDPLSWRREIYATA